MNDREISVLMDFIDEHLFEPESHWPKCFFDKRSYSRWAAYEMVERLMDHPFDSPDLIIEEFMLKMAYFSCQSKDVHKNLIFTTARDTAEDVLDIFLAMR